MNHTFPRALSWNLMTCGPDEDEQVNNPPMLHHVGFRRHCELFRYPTICLTNYWTEFCAHGFYLQFYGPFEFHLCENEGTHQGNELNTTLTHYLLYINLISNWMKTPNGFHMQYNIKSTLNRLDCIYLRYFNYLYEIAKYYFSMILWLLGFIYLTHHSISTCQYCCFLGLTWHNCSSFPIRSLCFHGSQLLSPAWSRIRILSLRRKYYCARVRSQGSPRMMPSR